MVCTYCTYLRWSISNMQSPRYATPFQHINSHLRAQYCKIRITTVERMSSMVTFKVKQLLSSPVNNEAWQSELPERTVKRLLHSSLRWISLWISPCLSNNFVYVCCGTCLERHLEHWDTALSPSIKREMKYSPSLLSPDSKGRINKT